MLMIKRLYDFDWLRSLIIINLIPFHVVWLMMFIPPFSDVSTTSVNAQLLQIYLIEVGAWHMPLLFLIAGYSAGISLSRRSLRQYSKERIKRLFIPLVVFMFTINIVQNYFTPWVNPTETRSLIDFVANYLPYYFRNFFNRMSGRIP
ncbi:acyltransferase family protein [Crocosphaera sp.]|uniref:acyltransferase family protein n=1 Tax=Crocosphaera sp. TaxID=2729996 RepID=UPI0034365BB1